ncbi:MAG: thioredoxin family protein [Alphaproteobacteria bacterium]|jgi:thiol-disulfide isomerase/thioredoxin|nr:thioredoxin family protein [Alphaproteobacteria bacterium]
MPAALVGLASALAWLAVALGTPSAAAAQATGPAEIVWSHRDDKGALAIDLYFFWSVDCPHCRRAEPFVARLAEEHAWLTVHRLEVSTEPENARRYVEMARALGWKGGLVPAFMFCGGGFVGYDEAETTGAYLRQQLTACHRRLGPDRAVSGVPTETAASPAPPPLRLPWLGEVAPADLSLPLLTVLLGGLDAFNPCAFFVLLFLLSLMVHARSRPRMLVVGGVFVLVSGLIYFLFMAAWLNLFLLVGRMALVTTIAGALAVAIAVLNLKDYVWPGRGPSLQIPETAKPGLYQRVRGLVGAAGVMPMLAGTVALAVMANTYELLCTAGFPLVFTRILTLHELPAPAYYGYLAAYNVVYVLPLFAIVVGFTLTLGSRKLTEAQSRRLKLLSGLMMLGLGLVLLLRPALLDSLFTALGLVVAAVVLTLIIVRLDPRRERPG